MKILEADLIQDSLKFSTDYTEKNYKGVNAQIFSRVLNSIAHGYYMGFRRQEARASSKFFPLKRCLTEKELEKETKKAAAFYIKKHRLGEIDSIETVTVHCCVSIGFRHGFKMSEIKSGLAARKYFGEF